MGYELVTVPSEELESPVVSLIANCIVLINKKAMIEFDLLNTRHLKMYNDENLNRITFKRSDYKEVGKTIEVFILTKENYMLNVLGIVEKAHYEQYIGKSFVVEKDGDDVYIQL